MAPYNDRLRAVALAKGAEFVDIAAGFQGDLSLLGSDGLHPTDAGYERIAQTFYDRIVALYEQPPTAAGVPAVRWPNRPGSCCSRRLARSIPASVLVTSPSS